MKFDYLVKHNGVYYKPGEDVPMEVNSSMGAFEPEEESADDFIVQAENIKTPKIYTKTEINRLSTAELRKLAHENDIDGDSYSGSELKKMLIEKLV